MDGDNDPYPDDPDKNGIVLWKSRSGTPPPSLSGGSLTAGREDRNRVGHPILSPAGRAELVVKAAMSRMDEQQRPLDEIAEDREALGRQIDEMRGTLMRQETTAQDIADAVTKRAQALRSEPKFWDTTAAELKAELWKRTPGLKDAYAAAMRDPDGFAKSKTNEHAEAFAILKRWADES